MNRDLDPRNPFVPGGDIGQYRIEARLGQGGMGEVFKAWDTKLNRPVAIKVLTAGLVDAAARRRFQREAQTASSLNHPHILTVFDVGEFEDRQYLVTEYVDGGTLQDWTSQSKRSPREVADLLAGVADGLATAHAAGILHRDIKPANILVSKSGYAKLADFGLAKLVEHTDADLTHTLTGAGTGRGMIVGTIPYMSPEQVSGSALGSRSDIFSFGVALYEALAGRRPFAGNSNLEILQAILHAAPEPLPDDIPAGLRGVAEKALEKDPAERYASAHDIAVDLRRMARPATTSVAPPKAARRGLGWAPWAAAAAVALGVAAWTLRPTGAPANPLDGYAFSRLTDFPGAESNPAISPDGKFVAFLSDRDAALEIWLAQVSNRAPANFTQGKLGNVAGPLRVIGFNGDGSEIWISGTDQRRLRLLPLVGGAPRNLLDAKAAEGAWSPDGTRLVYHTFEDGDPVFVADSNGGNVRPLIPAQPAGLHQHYQIWSPDGEWIYFVRGRPGTREMDLWRIRSSGGEPERLTETNSNIAYPAFLDARTLLYVAPDAAGAGPWLWALDIERRSTRRVLSGLEQYTAIAASKDGRTLAASVVDSQVDLWRVPILGRIATEEDVTPFRLPAATRAFAPRYGGESLFFLSSRGGGDGLWVYSGGRESEVWNGAQGAITTPAAVSKDGRRAAIALRVGQKTTWHVLEADGTGLRPLAGEIDARGAASWSPDGQWIATGGMDAEGQGLFKLPVSGGMPERIVAGAALDPVWSPNGDLIVYGGVQVFTGMPVLAVRPDGTPVPLPEITVRREGERARFLPDGSGLVYMQNDTLAQDFWLLDLKTMQSRQLTRLGKAEAMRTFDVTPDGGAIVFDRMRANSDIVLIEKRAEP